jgi:uncharacterized membrane protein YgcG
MMAETPTDRRTPAAQNNKDNGNAQPEQQQQRQQQDTPFSKIVSMMLRMLIFYWIFNYFRRKIHYIFICNRYSQQYL